MHIMARLRRCLFLASSLIGLSSQEDPIVDFCRRWGHQTAQVNGRLYIDGGMVDWRPGGANYTSETQLVLRPSHTNIGLDTALVFSDLNSSTAFGLPYQYANLSKSSEVPNVSGGILWPDEVNKCFYQFGGAFTNGTPSSFSMWTYDVLDDRWHQTKTKAGGGATQRVAYGAGTHIEDLGLGFYFGGYASNETDPDWTGSPIATSDLVRFEYTTGFLANNSGPEDNVGRAEGQMVYLPVSDSGLLVYFGGIEDPQQNGTSIPANMSEIHMYDVGSSKWYTQTATGNIPGPRRQFCAGVTWADDESSYNIYLYGGYGFGDPLAYDDIYILSLPSYTWIKAYPSDNSTNSMYIHGGCSANVVRRDQMLVIGGWFPETNNCDSNNVQGQHNMNLGLNGERKAIWDKYDPSLSRYSVPTQVIATIGGGPTGAATKTAPTSWDNPDLAVYYTLQAPSVTRTATRTLPSSTGTPSGGSSKSRVGAIAGGVVGGLAALIVILCLVLCCLRRKKKSMKKGEEVEVQPAELPPPVELGVTTAPQELPAHEVGKYMPVHQHEQHSPYSGVASLHSPHSTYAQQSSPGSPPHVTPYGSPHNNNYPQPAYPQSTHARSPSWETAQVSTMNSRYSNQGLNSPTPSDLPSYAPPQEVLYYPPPRESTYQPPIVSPASYNGYQAGQYRDNDSSPISPPPVSTMPTPTQFYARPAPIPGDAEGGYAHPPPENGSYASLEPQRRPKYGRFVEVDHT